MYIRRATGLPCSKDSVTETIRAEHRVATVAVLACQAELAHLTSAPLQLARRAEKSGRARRMLQW